MSDDANAVIAAVLRPRLPKDPREPVLIATTPFTTARLGIVDTQFVGAVPPALAPPATEKASGEDRIPREYD